MPDNATVYVHSVVPTATTDFTTGAVTKDIFVEMAMIKTRKATIHLENDNDIEIEASENCLENRYVGKITLNGNVPKQLFIECAELLKGRKFSSI